MGNARSFFPAQAMPNMNKHDLPAGFTLIEVMIVTVILAVISLAIFSTFSSGLSIYNRISSELGGEDLLIFCDRLGHDLRNSFNFTGTDHTGINFTGKNGELEFATLLNSPRMKKRTVGRVRYYFDEPGCLVNRSSEDYPGTYERGELPGIRSLENVRSCAFYYYFYDSQTQDFIWLNEWNKSGVPAAVRMELEMKDGPDNKFNRTFNIPAGNIIANKTYKVLNTSGW